MIEPGTEVKNANVTPLWPVIQGRAGNGKFPGCLLL